MFATVHCTSDPTGEVRRGAERDAQTAPSELPDVDAGVDASSTTPDAAEPPVVHDDAASAPQPDAGMQPDAAPQEPVDAATAGDASEPDCGAAPAVPTGRAIDVRSGG